MKRIVISARPVFRKAAVQRNRKVVKKPPDEPSALQSSPAQSEDQSLREEIRLLKDHLLLIEQSLDKIRKENNPAKENNPVSGNPISETQNINPQDEKALKNGKNAGFSAPGANSEHPGGDSLQPGGHSVLPGGDSLQSGGGSLQPAGHQVQAGGEQMQPGGGMEQPGGDSVLPGGDYDRPGIVGETSAKQKLIPLNEQHQPANNKQVSKDNLPKEPQKQSHMENNHTVHKSTMQQNIPEKNSINLIYEYLNLRNSIPEEQRRKFSMRPPFRNLARKYPGMNFPGSYNYNAETLPEEIFREKVIDKLREIFIRKLNRKFNANVHLEMIARLLISLNKLEITTVGELKANTRMGERTISRAIADLKELGFVHSLLKSKYHRYIITDKGRNFMNEINQA